MALVSAPLLKEPHIVFSDLPSGRTVVVGTECSFWGQRRLVFLTRHKESPRLTSDCFQSACQTTVKVGLPGILRLLLHLWCEAISIVYKMGQRRGENFPGVSNFSFASRLNR